jgi:hypothetical protein
VTTRGKPKIFEDERIVSKKGEIIESRVGGGVSILQEKRATNDNRQESA